MISAVPKLVYCPKLDRKLEDGTIQRFHCPFSGFLACKLGECKVAPTRQVAL